MDECAQVLAALLMYGKHPATPNSPRWVSFMLPDDFLERAENALAGALACELDPMNNMTANVGVNSRP